MITKEHFAKMGEAIGEELGPVVEKAREDTTPFAAYDGKSEQISVYGDPNKTQNKAVDLTIAFRYSNDDFKELKPVGIEKVKHIGKMTQYSRTYNEVTITPRKNTEVLEHLLSVVPYFTALEEGNNALKEATDQIEAATDKTDEEKREAQKEANRKWMIDLYHVYNEMSEDVVLALYNFVATLCGIGDEEAAHMVGSTVIGAAGTLLSEFPEVMNEAETLFGY